MSYASSAAQAAEPPVSTSFPFVLVANSHRITKLVDACDPIARALRERANGRPARVPELPPEPDRAAGRRASIRRKSLVLQEPRSEPIAVS